MLFNFSTREEVKTAAKRDRLPNAPGGTLTAKNVGTNSLALEWEAVSEDGVSQIEGYTVEQRR